VGKSTNILISTSLVTKR